jgi:hypothetical protein
MLHVYKTRQPIDTVFLSIEPFADTDTVYKVFAECPKKVIETLGKERESGSEVADHSAPGHGSSTLPQRATPPVLIAVIGRYTKKHVFIVLLW